MARRPSVDQVYQLDIRLVGIEPSIWRRIVVSDQITLASLHLLLQVVMGWEHSHLHQFIVGETHYGEPDPEDYYEMKDERRVKLYSLAREKNTSFVYEYDFGDGWRHRITVEDTWLRTEYDAVPRCLDGKRACPPENCGGIGGYQELLESLKDRRHPEHKQMRTWVGPHFAPELFSVQAVNSALAILVALGVTA